jgi:hypothetical protein
MRRVVIVGLVLLVGVALLLLSRQWSSTTESKMSAWASIELKP